VECFVTLKFRNFEQLKKAESRSLKLIFNPICLSQKRMWQQITEFKNQKVRGLWVEGLEFCEVTKSEP
jgi:hypothetical protein